MRSSILARIPGFRQRIIPEPSFPSQGSQARGTRLTSHEIGTLEAVDSEILGDYDACLYAGETLASCECYTRGYMYMRNTRNKTRCYSEDRRP